MHVVETEGFAGLVGLPVEVGAGLRSSAGRATGLVVITGPAGAGKSLLWVQDRHRGAATLRETPFR